MKILVVSNMYPNDEYPSYGVFVKRFCQQLETIGIDYDKSVMLKSGSKIKKIITYIKFYCLTVIKILLKKYDLVYIHYASHSGIPVLFARRLKKFSIYTNVHGSDVVPENSKQEKFQKYTNQLMKISERIIVPSDYFKDYVSGKYSVDKEKLYVYPSAGVNAEVFHPYKEEEKKEKMKSLGLEEKYTYVGFVGRISYGKGWDTFVKAASIVGQKRPEVRFIIVGSGPDREKLNALIDESGIESSIIRYDLLPQKELADLYNILSVFIFPTEREGESLGLVSVEAMACGVPVIASDYAAPKYYIQESLNGFKFEKANYKELAEKINLYLNCDDSKQREIRQNALKVSKSYLTTEIESLLKSIFK